MPLLKIISYFISLTIFSTYGYIHYKKNKDKKFLNKYFFIIFTIVLIISIGVDLLAPTMGNTSIYLYGLLAIAFFILSKYITKINIDKE